MTYFLTTGAEQAFSYSLSTIIVGVLGFVAAATLGSLAWYNSKRPPGWEDKERPDVVPDIDTNQ
ncbi:MAG: photosystem II assembly protein Psb35 [Phormidium sp.]